MGSDSDSEMASAATTALSVSEVFLHLAVSDEKQVPSPSAIVRAVLLATLENMIHLRVGRMTWYLV